MKGTPAPAILVVEDERIIAQDLQLTLLELGYEALPIASSADEAIARAAERCPDLVLMDIRIKGTCDGIETAELLTRQFGTPIVYLTAHADDAILERAMRTEPQGYLLKPVKSAELRSTIEVALYRHAMGKRLRERERWFSSALGAIADAVIAVDLAGNVTFMNPAAENLTGVTAAAGIGRTARDVVKLLAAGATMGGDGPIERALAEQCATPCDDAALERAGTLKTITSSGATPLLEDGVPSGAVMVFRDVTEQRLTQARMELAERFSSLATMAAGVAHEVSNALTVVVPNAAFVSNDLEHVVAELRATPRVTADQLRRLEDCAAAQRELRTAVDTIGNTMRDLKAFSRPAGPVDGQADVHRAIRSALRATDLGRHARVSVEAGAVSSIEGDEAQLARALAQLFSHAALHAGTARAKPGEVSISARDEGPGHVAIEVRDSGPAVPPEVQRHIFEPFFTSAASTFGKGFSLAICHGIIRSLGGEIAVRSTEGAGNTFRIRLARAERRAETVTPSLSAQPGRARILVIDDQPLVLRVVGRMLQGHDVVCVASAREALARLERGEWFELILSDVVMPDMSGIDLYEALLSRDPDLAYRIVFMSGGAVTENAHEFLRSVPNRRIDKPFTKAALLLEVKECLQAHRERAATDFAGAQSLR